MPDPAAHTSSRPPAASRGSDPWPYPVAYGRETAVTADVLVVGGGIAGCHAAINAAQRGADVVVIDKGAIVRSGSGGAGVDHWHGAYTNPCSNVTPEDAVERPGGGPMSGPYSIKHIQYVTGKEAWDAALDMEQWGMAIRDEDDDFVGAEFRDEATRLLFAYDYDERTTLRVFCACCAEHCPVPGALRMEQPLNQRVGWKRKSTGAHFRVGMKDPPPPNTRPPVGGWGDPGVEARRESEK